MVKQIMNTLFLSCLKATELIDKKVHIKLSFIENMQLKVHNKMCPPCKIYEQQSIMIEHAIEQHLQNNNTDINKNTEQLKQKIKTKLESERNLKSE